MGEPLGQSPGTLTNSDQPDDVDFDDERRRVERQRLMRDLPPQSGEGTALSDPDAALRRGDDPLDEHKPSPPRKDPLDPDGHVI